MNDFVDSLAYWLADYYLATTVLLAATLAAIRLCRQPVKRLAVAKAAIVAMTALAGLLALPGWSVVSLGKPGTTNEAELSESDIVPPVDRSRNVPVAIHTPKMPVVVSAPVPAANVTMPASKTTPNSWPAVVTVTYLIGLAGIVLWLVFGAIAARRLVRRAQPAPAKLSDLFQRTNGGRSKLAELLVSEEIDVAVALGVFRPRVLLPQCWANSRAVEELSTVLAHEAAHIRNGDLIWLTASRLVLVFLWAQPLYLLLRRSLRLDQEALADAAAAELAGRQRYAEQLVAWARYAAARPRLLLPAAMGLWEGPSQLRCRIAMLLDERLTMLRRCPRAWMLSATILVMALSVLLSVTTLEPLNVVRANQETSDSDSAKNRNILSASAAEVETVAADELTGVVEDESGRALAGVTVDAWTWFPGNETQTDERGRFSLRGFDKREPVEVQFTMPGSCPRLFVAQPVGTRGWVVTLNNRTYLEGSVLDPDGHPIAGVNIRATRGPFDIPEGGMITAVWTEIYTDANGRYRMYLEPGTYEMRVRQPGVGVARNENIVVRENEHREFDLQLKTGPIFRAHVIDSQTSEPVVGVRLSKWREPDIVGSSNKMGELEIANMLPGLYEFNVSADGEKSKFAEVAGDYARWWSPDALKEWQRLDLTDRGEGFQRNFDALEFDVRDRMEPVKIVVERGVKIRGLVVDPDGKPVAGATVAPAKTGSGNSLTGDTRYSVRTAVDGGFEMRLPASGAAKYNLVAHDGDYYEWRTWANGIGELLQTKPGDIIEDVNLVLSRPCVVRGQVQDANGKPVAKHQVRAQSADKRENRYYDPTTETNERGDFELRFVRPGKHYIQADPFWLTAEQGPREAWQLVDTSLQRPVEGVVLRLEAKDGGESSLHNALQDLREKATED